MKLRIEPYIEPLRSVPFSNAKKITTFKVKYLGGVLTKSCNTLNSRNLDLASGF